MTRIMTRCKICSCEAEGMVIDSKLYYHCLNCEFVFLDSEHHLSPEDEKKRYLLHDNTLENKGYVKMFERFIKQAVVPNCKPDSKILDYGSGPEPVLAEMLRRKRFEVEIYDKYFAEKKPKGKFDMVIGTEMIEHCEEPLKILEEMKDYLVDDIDDGKLILMTQKLPSGIPSGLPSKLPSADFPDNTEKFVEKFKNWHYRKDETHISFFSQKTFEYLAKRLNLKILEHKDHYWVFKMRCSD